jgi:guanylate kinase
MQSGKAVVSWSIADPFVVALLRRSTGRATSSEGQIEKRLSLTPRQFKLCNVYQTKANNADHRLI